MYDNLNLLKSLNAKCIEAKNLLSEQLNINFNNRVINKTKTKATHVEYMSVYNLCAVQNKY